jgi:hypothetical protein
MLRSFRLVSGLYPDDTKLLQPPFTQQHKRPLLPGRYSAFAISAWPKIDTNKRTITPIHFSNFKFVPMTNPASITGTKTILKWLLNRHLDSFIVTGQFLTVYRDSAILTSLS